MNQELRTYEAKDPALTYLRAFFCLITIYYAYRIVPLSADWVISEVQDGYRKWIAIPYGDRVQACMPILLILCYVTYRAWRSGYARVTKRLIDTDTARTEIKAGIERIEGSNADQLAAIACLENRLQALEKACQALTARMPANTVTEDPQAALEKLSQEFMHE